MQRLSYGRVIHSFRLTHQRRRLTCGPTKDGTQTSKEGVKENRNAETENVNPLRASPQSAAPRSSMSSLLHMIAEHQRTPQVASKRHTNNKRKSDGVHNAAEHSTHTNSTAKVGAVASLKVAASLFTSASNVMRGESQPKSRHLEERRSVHSPIASSSMECVSSTHTSHSFSAVSSTTGVSLSLVDKLRRNVRQKQLNWSSISRRHALLSVLPVWQQRKDWCRRFLPSAATPLTPFMSTSSPQTALCAWRSEVSVFVCHAPTGSGKSSLVPLFLLDTHWRRLLQRIEATHPSQQTPPINPTRTTPKTTGSSSSSSCAGFPLTDQMTTSSPMVQSEEEEEEGEEERKDYQRLPPLSPPREFPRCSTRDYVQEFGVSSRVCIVVSQPTRLACVELAKFTSAILASAGEAGNETEGRANETDTLGLVGGRVGYAVGGDVRFSPASEIVFATPGYIVNALHFGGAKGAALSPTTLVIDEAHCRDMETDLLLAWARHTLRVKSDARTEEENKKNEQHIPIRQLVLMSATMPVDDMKALFVPSGEEHKAKSPETLLIHNETNETVVAGGRGGGGGVGQNPYSVETFFLDDLPDALAKSRFLRKLAPGKQQQPKRQPHPQQEDISVPLLLPPARRLMSRLSYFFSYSQFVADIGSPQARPIAQFLLFILQTLAASPPVSPSSSSSPSSLLLSSSMQQQAEPESILVFLPGFAEMSLVLQSLELLCRPIGTVCSVDSGNDNKGENHTYVKNIQNNSAASSGGGGGGVVFLQYERWPFSIALLHASAIGSPQQQLCDTNGPYRHRIILATTVAESSVTIPNVRCVVDSCLERRHHADPKTGVTFRCTAVASGSSIQQRGGRTGRTCDGVVFYLAPRHLFMRGAATSPEVSLLHTGTGRRELTGLVAPSQSLPETITSSPAAVLLRVKHLFPKRPSVLMRHLPNPPEDEAIENGVQQLAEMGIIDLEMDELVKNEETKEMETSQVSTCNAPSGLKSMNTQTASSSAMSVLQRYDDATLTAKGEFIAYLPIPHEQALLIYYALQFACVDDAILLACAMTVPSLFITPRMTISETENPAMQYLQSLQVQRRLAGFVGEDRANGKLSEPLMLLTLLHEWYACSTGEDVLNFLVSHRINRSALRIVDNTIARCAARIALLLDSPNPSSQGTMNDMRMQELHGEHDIAVRRPSAQAILELTETAFPSTYRMLLRGSLQRLCRAALERTAHRLAIKSTSVAQWYPHDEQLVPLLLGGSGKKLSPDLERADTKVLGATCDRLAAAFVAAFARHTMRGEDGSHWAHHRRLVRNLSAIDGDTDHACSFDVELHSISNNSNYNNGNDNPLGEIVHREGMKGNRELYHRLTPTVVQRALGPYLVDAHLRQLELFATGRTAVARFAESENGTTQTEKLEDTSTMHREPRMAPIVLPFEREEVLSSAAVTLASSGISLFLAIQNSLSRLTLLLPQEEPTDGDSQSLNDDTEHANKKDAETSLTKVNTRADEGGNRMSLKMSHTMKGDIRFVIIMPPMNDTSTVKVTAHTAASNPGVEEDVCVMWRDSFGRTQTLRQSEVVRAGYGDFFPTPLVLETTPTDTQAVTWTESGDTVNPEVEKKKKDEHGEKKVGGISGDANKRDDPTHVLMSVQRVSFTRSVSWRVALPATPLSAVASRTSSSSSTPISSAGYCYCSVCHSTWPDGDALASHCRSTVHLSRLSLALRLGMRREWIETSTTSSVTELLVRGEGTGRMQLCAASASPVSFLNALQWHPMTGAVVMPIAVAGSLLSATLSSNRNRRIENNMTLHALHVWVLNGHAAPPPLFVLAGYLVAASTRFDTALLMNADHSLAYAVMLYDWGVWRFSSPIGRGQLRSVMEVFAGHPWRGTPDAVVESPSSTAAQAPKAVSPTALPHVTEKATLIHSGEALHWCVVSDVCPQCTYNRSGRVKEEEEEEEEKKKRHSFIMSTTADAAAESAVLLVLNEYVNSQRRVVSLADYTQRLVAKLNLWAAQYPSEPGMTKRSTVVSCCGSELLARLIARRRNQPLEFLLRDCGCQFLVPHRNGKGIASEKRFLPPPVLPSYVPSPDFSDLLRKQRNNMRKGRRMPKTQQIRKAFGAKPPQPSF